MRKYILGASAALLLYGCVSRGTVLRNTPPETDFKSVTVGTAAITRDKLKTTIEYLASPKLRGRADGSPGNRKAGDYLFAELESIFSDLPATSVVFQPFSISDEDDVEWAGRNVIGVLEGEEKRSEYIVLSAHYDSVEYTGKRYYPGADDNASGTAAVVEIARAYAALAKLGIRPQRSIIFLLCDVEEEGLWGSKYFVSHTLFPLKQIAAAINMDMIGRNARDEIHFVGADYDIFDAPKKNPQLYQAAIRAAEALRIKVLLSDEDSDDATFERSDHAPFFNARPRGSRIPVVFLFSGMHQEYHTPDDDADRIDFIKVEHVARLAFLTSWQIADAPIRPVYYDR